MPQLTYQITAGIPNFLAHIEPNEAADQITSSLGVYTFEDIPAGTYSLSVIDRVNCEVIIDGIVVVAVTTTSTTTIAPTLGYGAIYNAYVATDSRQIANTGWHLSTNAEWTDLMLYLDPSGSVYSNIAGGKLKETGLTYWDTPNTGATNEVGFNARGCGQRGGGDGLFYELNQSFYALREGPGNMVYCVNYNATFYPTGSGYSSNWGFAIRLVKDSTTLTHGQIGVYIGNDGKSYSTICIDNKEWVSSNLNETRYNNGDWVHGFDGGVYTPISDATWTTLTAEGMCYYNNDTNNG